ncbi:choice-of-anchor B family protein, partial [Eudoraea sp.]|uniref:choice-of-anchor B family protein n=1 Tax=Eudoraea sp. TaxID=1979955 RepID=UPI003C70A8A1
VDISDNQEFLYLGKLPTATTSSNWRDIKVYENHAFIVSEAAGHGMQVFDLTELRNVSSIPVIFDAVTRYTGFGNAHNIVINEESGYAYVVGTNRNDLYSGGAHFIDIKDPINPIAAGGYGDSGYSHDAHVVNYFGPDPDYMGRELMVGANENQITIVDVTNKDNPQLVNSFGYSNIGYTHQGWFTENQRYFILGDELDELNFGFDSRTLIFDLSDLDNPILHSTYIGPTAAIDHNGYVIDNEFYLANYTAGIRILDLADVDEQPIVEKAYFDTYLQNDNAVFEGVWSLYPFFESGKIIVNDINSGLFVLAKSN